MDPNQIIYPVFALVLLTFFVQLVMARARFGYSAKHKIHPQSVATRQALTQALGPVENPANNFMNLFEVPVLFYALAALLLATDKVTPALVTAAWVFVALRAVHSLIHCTYNRVMHRFAAYASSCMLLLGMWVAFVVSL